MTDPATRQHGMTLLFHDIKNKTGRNSVAEPGRYVCWYLSRFIDPGQVAFADYGVDAGVSSMQKTTGAALLVGAGSLWVAGWQGVSTGLTDTFSDHTDGTISLGVHRVADVQKVAWTASPSPSRPGLDAGAVRIIGDQLNESWPRTALYNGDADYLAALLAALDYPTQASNWVGM